MPFSGFAIVTRTKEPLKEPALHVVAGQPVAAKDHKEGRPKFAYEFWHDHLRLRPLSRHLRAQMLEYPRECSAISASFSPGSKIRQGDSSERVNSKQRDERIR